MAVRLAILAIALVQCGRAVEPGCSIAASPDLQSARELFRVLTPAEALGPDQDELVLFAPGARALYVSVRPLSMEAKRLNVTLEAKTEPAGPFATVCEGPVLAFTHDDARVLKVESPPAARWRLRISGSEPVGLGIVVYGVPSESPGTYPLALDFVCIAQNTWLPLSSVPQNFLQQVAPVFRIEDPSRALGSKSIDGVQASFIDSVAAWNVATRTTSVGIMVASVETSAGRRDFINSRLAKYLTIFPPYDSRSMMIVDAYRNVDQDLAVASQFPGNDRWIDSSMFTPLDPPLRAKFCAVDPSVFYTVGTTYSPTRDAHTLVCGSGSPRPVLTVRLVDKLSPIERCTGPYVFGCELGDGHTIELDVSKFSFTSHDEETPLFGRGSVSVDILIVWLHELGHLLGLTHESLHGVQTIMDSFPAPLACLDNQV